MDKLGLILCAKLGKTKREMSGEVGISEINITDQIHRERVQERKQ